MAWMVVKEARREMLHQRQRIHQLELLQLASYGMTFFWTMVMFVGYRLRPALVPADLAGIVTAFVLFGGATVVWRILHLKRIARHRLERAIETNEANGAEREAA